MKHEFLTPEWIDAARAIRDEFRQKLPAEPGVSVRANLVVCDTPSGRDIAAHIDAADGRADIELGHLDSPEVTITTDHATARAIFADNDGSVAMAAFLGGKIRVEGDVAKLMVLMAQAQQRQAEPLAVELAQRVRAITADAT